MYLEIEKGFGYVGSLFHFSLIHLTSQSINFGVTWLELRWKLADLPISEVNISLNNDTLEMCGTSFGPGCREQNLKIYWDQTGTKKSWSCAVLLRKPSNLWTYISIRSILLYQKIFQLMLSCQSLLKSWNAYCCLLKLCFSFKGTINIAKIFYYLLK